MSPIAGERIGLYDITAKLGQGGMGEVWRATDARLGREVALKLLPEGFADDPERHARFEREARVLASLNHPNIATLFGLEHVEDRHLLVMELVEGEGLDERVARGPIPVDEAIPIALQIAEGLEAAHEAGIVHRDLKPANIRIRPDGTVKVLDFGLAKSWERDVADGGLTHSPTITSHHTKAGVLLGTAAYMSPEQARGRPVDRRADIWAFGAVLWEMLTGRRLFEGETVSDVLAAVLTREPEAAALPADTPPGVVRVLSRCLRRDLRQRLQWIGDARLDLETFRDQPEGDGSTSRKGFPVWLGVLLAAVASVALLSTFALTVVRPGPVRPVARTTRLEITGMSVTNVSNVAISPDGTRVVAWDESVIPPRLIWRAVDSFEIQPVPGPVYGFNPFFAPDNTSFGYFGNREVCVTTLAGGPNRCLAPAEGFATGDWSDDGTIVFSNEATTGDELSGVWAVAASGGAPRQLTRVDVAAGEISHTHPHVVPGRRSVLFTIRNREGFHLAVIPLDGGERRPVLSNAMHGLVLPSGVLVFEDTVTGTLRAARVHIDTLELTGPVVEVQRNLARTGDRGLGFDLSATGTLVYTSNDLLDQGFEIVRVDRSGRVEPLVADVASWTQPQISPDGRTVVVRRTANPDCSLWLIELDRHSLSRLTFDGDNHVPLWFGGSGRIVSSRESGQGGHREAVWLPTDGSGASHPLFEGRPGEHGDTVSALSSDGRYVALADEGRTGRDDIVIVDRSTGTAIPFLTSRFDESWPEFSPDGNWLAYSSNETGRYEVYVRRFPEGDSKHLVSMAGGRGPIWSRDGRELYYAEGKRLMAVAVRPGAEFSAGVPAPLFGGDEYIWSRVRNYDVFPDGSAFVMIRAAGGQAPIRSLRVVTNWAAEVEEMLSGGRGPS